MKSFDFDRVHEVRVTGLADFELVVDAGDGDKSLVVITGSGADAVAVLSDGGVVTVRGQDGEVSRGSRSVSMSGTFVTGNVTVPVLSVPKDPLHIRYGGLGEAPVRIEVSVPAGQRIVLHGPFKTVTTAAPHTRSGGASHHAVPGKLRRKAEELLEQARQDRSDGSLAGAIRGHVREQEAHRLIDDGDRAEK